MFENVGVRGEGSASGPASSSKPMTLLCFSHLRWDFVFQRPQHLMNRFARAMPVVVWEEPIAAEAGVSADVDGGASCVGPPTEPTSPASASTATLST